ncbi:hypothetical protein N7532_007054 [Penicillium argentinense]|uniref:Zn(2)-C6 fungal-type domain-containing protein n=1 Tax=Penicillium argentinense TaxID=1131581 RepID=A0A9W9FH54_9EURO|nr:uncharacterized protein N7532_007054 [Penicillium argentinense]KAJ5100053.1 hypothetical protein N7532_007054 [Penicillium argentinense]
MFQCSQCEKSYQRRTHLLRHQDTRKFKDHPGFDYWHRLTNSRYASAKLCAKKHNQPSPVAARPGRKRQSCDLCFSAKAACDKNLPCSRCVSIRRECVFTAQGGPSTSPTSRAALACPSPSFNLPPGTSKGNGPFSFLRHFTNPSIQKDRLAIGETAKYSLRRNLETLYSRLEVALVPTDPTPTLASDLQIPDLPFQMPSSSDESMLTQLPSEILFPSKLSNQLTEIMAELVETSKSMISASVGASETLDIMELTTLLGVSNISAFISAFFHSLHWHLPIVHFPTFDPGDVSNPLLLAIFMAGAAYTTPLDGASMSPWLLDVAEEYIFRKVCNLPAMPPSRDPATLLPTLQLIQSALIIEMLQFGRDDLQTRRRIRIIRNPCLVSTIRSLGMFQFKRSVFSKICDERAWRIMVAEEMCIRVACWVFLSDAFLTVCFKNHPSVSTFEMNCDFPWSAELWEAESPSAFGRIAAEHSPTEQPLPTLREVISQLLDTPIKEQSTPWGAFLSSEHLLMLIYAINSLAFQARVGLLKYLPIDTISCAASNWKRIWDSVVGSSDQEQILHLGYPKHAEELWWLLKATLEVSEKPETDFAYLGSNATDELGTLNDFIRSCYHNV